MRMVQQHLRMVGITHILCTQAIHDTTSGLAGYGAGKFIRVFGQCYASIIMSLNSAEPVGIGSIIHN